MDGNLTSEKALAAVKSTLKFANGNDVKQAIDDEVLSRLGPKPADLNAQKKAEKKVESKPANNNNNNNNNVKVEVKENIVVDPETFYDTLPDSVQFHDPKFFFFFFFLFSFFIVFSSFFIVFYFLFFSFFFFFLLII